MDLVADPAALSDPAHQGARHPHRVGRLRRADQRFRRGGRARSSRARSGDVEEGQRGAAVLRQLRQSARHHGRFLAAMLPAVVKALIDDPNVGMLFISFPISYAAMVKAFNKGMADSTKPKVMVALGDTWQLAPTSCRPSGEPGGVLALVRPDAARDHALHPLRPLLARTRVPACRRRFPGMPKLGQARSRNGSARRCSRRRAFACPLANLRAAPDEAAAVAHAHRLPGRAQGAGRGAIAQDRSRRRRAQPRRRGRAARGLGHDAWRASSAPRPASRSTAPGRDACRARASS